jgi:hypothetical protein
MLFKLIRETKNEEYSKDFFMWEKDKLRNTCRGCNNAFTMVNRRHHCRLCGGLYCENCAPSNVTIGTEVYDRVCSGCYRKEVPGAKLRGDVETRIASLRPDPVDPTTDLIPIQLNYGSDYEPSNTPRKMSPLPAPSSNYFEIINKSSSFCAVKLLILPERERLNEYEITWEVPRPSYAALPPNELLHADISMVALASSKYTVFLYLLFGNPNIIPGDVNSIAYNTRAPIKVAACAAVENFWEYSVYQISCKGRNVLLKLKDGGSLETRVGNSLDRKGLMARFGGSAKNESELDFSTNIASTSLTRVA